MTQKQVSDFCLGPGIINPMKQLRVVLAGLLCVATLSATAANPPDVMIAQLSDTHLGEKHSPQAADNLRKAVEMINARHPDAVILSGDLGERPENREQVKEILKAVTAPIFYVPGNHDFHDAKGLERYRKTFGRDYYRFQVKNVEVLALNSQLLGNYQKFDGPTPPPLLDELLPDSQRMLAWLGEQAGPTKGKIVIAVQHIPLFRDKDFPDAKPYWTVNDPYAQRELDLLRKLGVKHLLAGHWHNARVFDHAGITTHVAPATSWLPLGGQLGFAMHTVSATGDLHTEFVYFPDAARQEPPAAAPDH